MAGATEPKRMKLNTENESLYGGIKTDVREPKDEWSCSVCKKGVGSNSSLCTNFMKWVHK